MNRLQGEPSLYLRQHQANPVDWYPWGDEAFAEARRRDSPLLLSVGYSTCHWCHVMAHESFEDPVTAEVQNRLFVSVKVDREERPDVDRVYMEALLAMTGSGGWPMTVFLLPDGRPYYAGTYFPPQDRHGLPAFRRVLAAAAAAYRDRRGELEDMAGRLQSALQAAPAAALGGAPDDALLRRARDRVLVAWDPQRGGLAGSPKFPQAPLLEFLLTRGALTDDGEASRAAGVTLAGMAQGGIRDQLAGGFHRYSVDDRWEVPHFEKMLYDQAQLVTAYLHYGQLEREPRATQVAVDTADALLREFGLEGGAFAAGLDADSGSAEGSTYLWTEAELDRVAGGPTSWRRWFRLGETGPEGGAVLLSLIEWGARPDPPDSAEARRRLLSARSRRPQPARDEKAVVAWNALAVAALTELGLATGEGRFVDRAEAAGEMLWRHARAVPAGLAHVVYGSEARLPATLEDRAATALAALWLHEATGAGRWFEWAEEIGQQAERLHSDGAGLWFDAPAGSDSVLPTRPTTLEEGAARSGISLMVQLCWRLQALTGEAGWGERAGAALARLGPRLAASPTAFGGLLADAEVIRAGPVELALIGAPGSHRGLLRAARSSFRPQLAVAVGGPDGAAAPLARERPAAGGRPTAYVCRDFACRQPTAEADDMVGQLDGRSPL